jgi:outer membrane receptor protein involved in Fe transport
VSRAVRIPSRLDADLQLTSPISIPGVPFPVYVRVSGSHDVEAERLSAYESGYRFRVGDALSFDIAVFDNHYDKLETTEPQNPVIVPVPPLPYAILPNYLANGMKGRSTGGTVVVNWEPKGNWRLRFEYSHLSLHLWNEPASRDTTATRQAGNSPENQIAVQAFADLGRKLGFYAGLRRVGALPNQGVPAYTALDANLRWQIDRRLDISFAVRNLADSAHLEFGSAGAVPIERSGIVKFAWTM